MEVVFVTNGGTKLVLIPEKEIERILLQELLSKGSVTADIIKGPVDIMGQPAQGGLLLRTKDYDVTIKTEDVRGVQLAKEYMEESREAEVL
jgi:hypothetical protein